jgi:hypothetical protein
MTEQEIIKKIHAEFDNSTTILINIVEKEKNLHGIDDPAILDSAEKLKSIGFSNTKIVKETEDLLNEYKQTIEHKEFYKNLSKVVNEYSKRFPKHKFILYSQVEKILEKYNLYLGYSELYNGDIPEKNIYELIEFNEKYKHNIDSSKFKYFDAKNIPLCGADLNTIKYSEANEKTQYYICAPKKDFQNKIKTFKREVYEPNYNLWLSNIELDAYIKARDPIILLPVKTYKLNTIGFVIVTKWGLEAEDKNLQ